MAILDDVKLALRISHSVLNTEITAQIAYAKAEMERVGIDPDAIDDTDPLILEAIKTYCKYNLAAEDKKDGYFTSWQYQLDCLRRSTRYKLEVAE